MVLLVQTALHKTTNLIQSEVSRGELIIFVSFRDVTHAQSTQNERITTRYSQIILKILLK